MCSPVTEDGDSAFVVESSSQVPQVRKTSCEDPFQDIDVVPRGTTKDTTQERGYRSGAARRLFYGAVSVVSQTNLVMYSWTSEYDL